jgi:hypothetical protein
LEQAEAVLEYLSITDAATTYPNVTLAAVGSSPNANGASLTGQALTLQPANGTQPGVLTAVAQDIAGVKTFAAKPVFTPGITATGSSSIGALTVPNYLESSGIIYARGHKVLDDGDSPLTIESGVTDGASAVAIKSNSVNALSTAGASLHDFQNAGVRKAYVDKDGGLVVSGVASGSASMIVPSGSRLYLNGAASGNAFIRESAGYVDIPNLWVTNSFVSSVQISGPSMSLTGNAEVTDVGSGFILKSPDGTRYKISVANGGALSAVAV